jgi:predicted ATP-grasp superfamily ATP-dependent carboligase
VIRVLVTDASYRNALGAIRSLGGHGCHVIAGSPVGRAQGFLSRYAHERVVYPSPRNEETFVSFLAELVERQRIDVVLPVGYTATTVLSRNAQRLPVGVGLPVAAWPTMEVAADKSKTLSLAQRVGIPVPKTFASARDVDAFPVVVKESLESGRVRYVNDARELHECAAEGCVIQEYIPGDGFGFFALFEHGAEKALFMHQRIREFPVTGGPSTVARSIYDPVLRDLGVELLRALRWHGVAMVEFKKDRRDGGYRLMEVNPKFWGSLDLSIAAGVDFPWLAVLMALGLTREPVLEYRTEVRFQWVFDDLLRSAARPRDLPAFLRDAFSGSVEHDLRWSDPKPALLDGALTFGALLAHVYRGTLRRPHGSPRYPKESGPATQEGQARTAAGAGEAGP